MKLLAKEFTNFGLKEYPECGTPLEVLEFHKLDGKSLAQRISGVKDIETQKSKVKIHCRCTTVVITIIILEYGLQYNLSKEFIKYKLFF